MTFKNIQGTCHINIITALLLFISIDVHNSDFVPLLDKLILLLPKS